MIKMLLTFAVLGAVGGFAGLAMAQDKRAETQGGDASSSQAKLDAQCAHRRVMPPDPRDECARRLRSNAQLGQDGGYASGYGADPGNAGGQGNSIGPGNAGGQGNSIGPGNGGGGGQAKGRR